MAEKNVLVVVLGYGCHLTEPMKHYLDLVIDFSEISDVVAIVTTGGYTNRKNAPGVSEAGMMADYLKECGVVVPLILEESSVTTNQNLQSITRVISERNFDYKRLVIFCDGARSIKVKILARLILGHWPEVMTYELTKSFIAKLKQLFIATPFDVLASKFPFFEKMELRRKERIMNSS
ncbi:MAG: ElyC/SanA/YdcF family protein [Patescibacteria group bacterium]